MGETGGRARRRLGGMQKKRDTKAFIRMIVASVIDGAVPPTALGIEDVEAPDADTPVPAEVTTVDDKAIRVEEDLHEDEEVLERRRRRPNMKRRSKEVARMEIKKQMLASPSSSSAVSRLETGTVDETTEPVVVAQAAPSFEHPPITRQEFSDLLSAIPNRSSTTEKNGAPPSITGNVTTPSSADHIRAVISQLTTTQALMKKGQEEQKLASNYLKQSHKEHGFAARHLEKSRNAHESAMQHNSTAERYLSSSIRTVLAVKERELVALREAQPELAGQPPDLSTHPDVTGASQED